MTLTEHKIWHLPLILLALWLGACSMQSDFEEEPQLPTDNLNLVLSIHTGDRNLRTTRAGNDDGVTFEETELPWEMMKTLRIIIVNKITGEIAYNDYITLPEADVTVEGLKYKVDFDTAYTIYLIANEDGLPRSATIFSEWKKGDLYVKGSLESTEIGSEKAGDPFITVAETPVPMTEIFDIVTVSKPETLPSNNEVVQNETFFVTRTACKFSFYFFRGEDFQTADNLEIQKIKISGLGKNEYLFPYETVYSPTKETNRTSVRRDIKAFTIPNKDNGVDEYDFELTSPFSVNGLPLKPEGFDSNNPTAGLSKEEIRQFIPQIYFPESKGNTTGNQFECSITFDGEEYVTPVALPNLPHALPRNTHVVVIVTVHDRYIEATVDVIPFTSVEVAPDYGLSREEYTGYVVGGKDQLGNQYWYDANYYEPVDENDPPVKYYLGPTGHEGELVTINGKEYMLVYTDIDDYSKPIYKEENGETVNDQDGNPIIIGYEKNPGYNRTAAHLNHIFTDLTEKDEKGEDVIFRHKYLLTPEGRTGYQIVKDMDGWNMYLNRLKQKVWLDEDLLIKCYRTLNEWDRLTFAQCQWGWADQYPKAWFDILGNRYKWSEGETPEKRREAMVSKIGEEWLKYLE